MISTQIACGIIQIHSFKIDMQMAICFLPFKAVTVYQYGTKQAWNFYIFAVSNSHRT